jgi:hypothetical protein
MGLFVPSGTKYKKCFLWHIIGINSIFHPGITAIRSNPERSKIIKTTFILNNVAMRIIRKKNSRKDIHAPLCRKEVIIDLKVRAYDELSIERLDLLKVMSSIF